MADKGGQTHLPSYAKCAALESICYFLSQTTTFMTILNKYLAIIPSTSVMAFPQILEPLQCKTCFNRYLGNGRSNPKNSKNEVHFFFEFCFWEDPLHPVNWSLTHSTGPQTLFFADISVMVTQIKKIQKQGAFFIELCFWEDPLHPVNWSLTHSTGP